MAKMRFIIVIIVAELTFGTKCQSDEDCQDIRLPEVQEFVEIKNSKEDVIGYRIVLVLNDVEARPTWHRFHQIPEVRSYEYNYPLSENDANFEVKVKYSTEGILETSVEILSEFDGHTRFGLHLDLNSKCGPMILYIKVDIPDMAKVKTFPIVRRKSPGVLILPKICEDQSLQLSQSIEIKNEALNINGTAGLTKIFGKRIGVNDVEEIYEAYEFNPFENEKYELDTSTDEKNNSLAKQSWLIKDVRETNVVGVYQFYITLDTNDPLYKSDPKIYMLSLPFVIKPDLYEATSIGIHPCFPFRMSRVTAGDGEPPVKHLGSVLGYRPCFRVLVQTSQSIRLKLTPYDESALNPQPSYSGPTIGGMTEYWYVLDDDKVPNRRNRYYLWVSTHDHTFTVPFDLTKYTPALPVLTARIGDRNQVTLNCTASGYPEPELEFYEMNKLETLGGDTHWDLEKLHQRYTPLASDFVQGAYDDDTKITSYTKSTQISSEFQTRLNAKTFNQLMPYGVACVAWNDFSHNIAFWSPVLAQRD